MRLPDDVARPHIATISVAGQRFTVSVVVSYDGIEFVGRLWFHEEGREDEEVADRGVIPGRSKEEVIVLARRLSGDELGARYKRAVANRRRFLALRSTTDEVLRRVRYLNHVAISMQAGLIDVSGAEQEIRVTEGQLHELVRRLRAVAGQESFPA